MQEINFRVNSRNFHYFLKLIIFFISLCFLVYLLKEEEVWNLKTIETSQNYCVIYDYWKANEKYTTDHITLVLHTTIEYFHHLENQINTWQGGISVALLLPNPGTRFQEKTVKLSESHRLFRVTFSLLQSTVFLKTSFNSVPLNINLSLFQAIMLALDTAFPQSLKNSGQISLHLFFEKSSYMECPTIHMPLSLDSFEKLDLIDIQDTNSFNRYYPINTARNIARNRVRTELFISGDIEQTYVQNFESRMFKLAKKVLLE